MMVLRCLFSSHRVCLRPPRQQPQPRRSQAPVRAVLACGLRAAASAGQPRAWGASGNGLARRVPGRAARGGRADPRGGQQREQGAGGGRTRAVEKAV
jgi:hypothetical protein